jgi:hypothetical protein
MTQKVNQESMPAISLFGLRILFDGYLITAYQFKSKRLVINDFLFDGHLIEQ